MAAFFDRVCVPSRTTLLKTSFLSKYLYFSTETAVQPENFSLPRFRTLENDPTCHTLDHEGKFYTINPKLVDKLFFSGGITKSLEIQMKTFRESCIMVRKPALEVFSYLKQWNFSLPALRFVIYGKDGTGKTCSLMHILHYGYASRFLILHIPWVSNWTKRPKEIVESQSRPGRIDLPTEAAIWLQHFKLQNLQLLQELDLKTIKSYSWSMRETTEEGQPILDVLDHGIQRVPHASDCLAVLLKEIKHHSQFGKFKTMVVIDGVNAFYSKTNVKRPDKTLVSGPEISLIHAFEKVLKNDWTNAVIIASVDTMPKNRDRTTQICYTPRALLGKEGFELLDPFIPILVENYTEKEIESMLDYYIDRKWIQTECAQTENGRKQLKFLSGYNPYYLMKICDPL